MTDYSPEWTTGIASRDPWTDQNVTAERKYDGWHAVLHYGDGKPARLLSRTGRDIGAHLGWMLPGVMHCGLTVLDCELVAGSGPGDVASLVAGARIPGARLVCFDVMCWRGFDTRTMFLAARRVARNMAAARCGISVVQHTDGDKRAFTDAILMGGGEGVVLKDLRAVYGRGLMKVKRVDTVDAFVSAIEATTRGRSMVLSQWRGTEAVEVARVPAGRAGEPASPIGCVAALAGQGWTSNGKVRSARVDRWRDDKTAAQCVAEEL